MLVTRSRFKTALLAVLVVLSVVLSYLLWSGRWQQTSEVAYSEGDTLTNADDPRLETALSPIRWVFMIPKPERVSVAVPGSAAYTRWQELLRTARVENLHPLSAAPQTSGMAARVEFGTALPFRILSYWMPGLSSLGMLGAAQTVTFYTPPSGKPVRLLLANGSSVYGADTDVDPAAFQKDLEAAVAGHEWMAWNDSAGSYIPRAGQHMRTFSVRWQAAQTIPLVHSFFVNPMALTRIDEGPHTVLWTDGSRVVWWDQGNNTLSYTDPNPPPATGGNIQDVSMVLQYVRGHGGAEPFCVIDSSDAMGETDVYEMHPYVDGFPVLTARAASELELQGGRVVSYRRPLANLDTPKPEGTVTTMGADGLQKVLRNLMPTTPVNTLEVRLGYALSSAASGEARLVPAFFVTQSGLSLWVIDAVNGRVLQGMGAQ